ncbi:hypothetical protein Tco_1537434 [Tanacetum coccineum]
MENANPPTNNQPALLAVLHVKLVQELYELQTISALLALALRSPFLDSDYDSDDSEDPVEPYGYGDAEAFSQKRLINGVNGDDLAFECMIGFRKFTAYLDLFLPVNIIMRKAYNTIMVRGLRSTEKNWVTLVKNIHVFVGSFTYKTDFVVLENIGGIIIEGMSDVVVGEPFRAITQLGYNLKRD